jgi:Cysteine dioxygenase type I
MNSAELTAFVQGLAARPQLWSHLVEHDRVARCYSELIRNDDVAAWLICWMDEHDTGFHDHDVSAGAVAVGAGSVREDRLVLGSAPSTRVVHAGDAFSFESSDIHRVQHAGAEPAVTLHA